MFIVELFAWSIICNLLIGVKDEAGDILWYPLAPSNVAIVATTYKPRFSHKRFSSDDDDVQPIVLLWMRQQPKEFYAAGIGALIKRWDKCINIGGDYAEK
ncbi:hypothetical protein AVEN_29700-1 [Araneus ventricosus]|uniref:Uncharacterized protein n=1 Tax=Araneus ventricosus TaxID=182803 RepID=A0A4Y2TIF5_ARAVE|nr:hypothetical protein AVEN_29700-1 [Araneus ventricosus]